MTGKNHIITGVSTVIIVDTSIKLLFSKIQNIESFSMFRDFINKTRISDIISKIAIPKIVISKANILPIILCFCFFLIGCLLPDIDSKKSLLGRYIHIPIEHGTWTHTVWFLMIISSLFFLTAYSRWLFYGCFLHLFYDSLSKKGVCWFYPISQYRKYPSGAKVKKGYHIRLYSYGKNSETIVVTVVLFLCFALLLLFYL